MHPDMRGLACACARALQVGTGKGLCAPLLGQLKLHIILVLSHALCALRSSWDNA